MPVASRSASFVLLPSPQTPPRLTHTAHEIEQFLKVDVDQVPDVAQKYSVRAMPTFVVLRGSSKIDEVSPAPSVERPTPLCHACSLCRPYRWPEPTRRA